MHILQVALASHEDETTRLLQKFVSQHNPMTQGREPHAARGVQWV